MADWEASADKAARAAVKAQMKERAAKRSEGFKMPNGAEVMACGGGREQVQEPAE
jgi:anaerobic magnesium-protoporphyrin IX monomethyl ester cyclase